MPLWASAHTRKSKKRKVGRGAVIGIVVVIMRLLDVGFLVGLPYSH